MFIRLYRGGRFPLEVCGAAVVMFSFTLITQRGPLRTPISQQPHQPHTSPWRSPAPPHTHIAIEITHSTPHTHCHGDHTLYPTHTLPWRSHTLPHTHIAVTSC